MERAWIAVRVAETDTWRRELCPDCGLRLIGLAAWKGHGRRHGWASDWFAARLRAGRPGEIITFNPELFQDSEAIQVETVEDATWKAGIAA